MSSDILIAEPLARSFSCLRLAFVFMGTVYYTVLAEFIPFYALTWNSPTRPIQRDTQPKAREAWGAG